VWQLLDWACSTPDQPPQPTQAVGKRGEYAIDQTQNHRGPALDRVLVVIQAATEELEGIA
jgi:hypothetical protein